MTSEHALRRTSDQQISMAVKAGIAGWLIPGLGHFIAGHRAIGCVFFAAITLAFGTGLAVGGIKNSVNPWSQKWLFVAEAGIAGYTVPALLVNLYAMPEIPARRVQQALAGDTTSLSQEALTEYQGKITRYISFYPSSDIAQIYLSIAGLMNVLAVVDAVARAITGKPTFPESESKNHIADPVTAT